MGGIGGVGRGAVGGTEGGGFACCEKNVARRRASSLGSVECWKGQASPTTQLPVVEKNRHMLGIEPGPDGAAGVGVGIGVGVGVGVGVGAG